MNDSLTVAGLRDVAEQVARSLSRADLIGNRAFVRTGVLFPSGSVAVVVIEEEGGGWYRVSDLRQGRDEAELAGAAGPYDHRALEVARLSGLALEDGAFVLTRVTAGQLAAAAMAVANASSRALERTLSQTARRPNGTSVDRLVGRLAAAFPGADIARDTELRGASTHAWGVDALVTTGRGLAVFDIVTPHPTSVAFATAKFHDFALLDNDVARIAVVHRKAELGDLLTVVAQAARVIEADASDSVFLQAALAA